MGNQDQHNSSDEIQNAGSNIQDGFRGARQAYDDISNLSKNGNPKMPGANNPTPKPNGSKGGGATGAPNQPPSPATGQESNALNLAQQAGQKAMKEGGKQALQEGGKAIGAGAGKVAVNAGAGSAAGPVGTAIGTILGLVGAFGKYIVRFLLILSFVIMMMGFMLMSFPSIFMQTMVDKIVEETNGNPAVRIVMDAVTGLFVWLDDMGIQTPMSNYKEQANSAAADINTYVQGIYDGAVEQSIQQAIQAGYDESLTRSHVVHATSIVSDVSYLQAVYSIVTPLESQSMADLVEKSKSIPYFSSMTTEAVEVVPIPQKITKYKEEAVTYVDPKNKDKMITETLYTPDGTEEIKESNIVPAYKSITVNVYEQVGNTWILVPKTYYRKEGTTNIVIQTKDVKYLKILMLSRQGSGIDQAFNFDRAKKYVPNFPFVENAIESEMTNGQWADQTAYNYAKLTGFKRTGYSGERGAQIQEPLSEEEIYTLLSTLSCSTNRKSIVCNALSCVGRVPYFWAGRTGPGWDVTWGELREIEFDGSDKQLQGELWPWGLDCSGFVSWCYKTTFDKQFDNPLKDATTYVIVAGDYTEKIEEKVELLPGDILIRPGDGHTAIFFGFDKDGKMIVIHEAGAYSGCVMGIDDTWSSYWRCKTVSDGQKDYMEENNQPIKIPFLVIK